MTSCILYQTDAVCVEYFAHANPKLALVFSPLMKGDLKGGLIGNPAEGVRLLEHGFDVLAFKINNDDWFQSVPPTLLKALANLAVRRGYVEKVAYGTAMGGYAALAFSGILNLNRALLVSPQYRLDEGLTISPDCQFFIVLDNKSADNVYLAPLLSLIPREHARVIKLPYAGQPCSPCLIEAGLLAQLELQVLDQASCEGLDFARAKGQSVAYLANLGTALLNRNKLSSALWVTQKALAINDGIWSFHFRRAQILGKLGRHYEAIPSMHAALALEPGNPELHYHLSLSLLNIGLLNEALQASGRALELVAPVTGNHGFWGYHSNLLWRNHKPEDSLNAILKALELDPANAGYHAHKSGMLQALGRLDEAIRAASDAVALAPDNQANVAHFNALRAQPQQPQQPPQNLPPPIVLHTVSLDKLLAPWH